MRAFLSPRLIAAPALVVALLVLLGASDAAGFQFYAPWTAMGDADAWYAIGPDPTHPAKVGAPLFYGVATSRSRVGPSGRESFVTVESRNAADEGLKGCSKAPGYADLGMPHVAGAANAGLAPGQPFWVGTPALAHDWVFITVLDTPMPTNTPDFQFHGHVFAKHRNPTGADLCTGWATDWIDLGHGNPWAGSAPSALTIPAGETGAGTTYVCTDTMHELSSPGAVLCKHTSDNAHWSGWQTISSDNSLTYVVGQPTMAYDTCKHRVVMGQAANDRDYLFFILQRVDPSTGNLTTLGNQPGTDPSISYGRVVVPGESWQIAGTPSIGFAGCTMEVVVRAARTVTVSGRTIPATGSLGNPVVYITGHHDGAQLMVNGWTWGPRLDAPVQSVGIPAILSEHVKVAPMLLVLDENTLSRQYLQWTLGPGGFTGRKAYTVPDPGVSGPVLRPGLAVPAAPVRH